MLEGGPGYGACTACAFGVVAVVGETASDMSSSWSSAESSSSSMAFDGIHGVASADTCC